MKAVEQFSQNLTKNIRADEDPSLIIHEFTDIIVSADGKKKETVKGKGELNCGISMILFEYLESYHVPTHFLRRASSSEMIVKGLEPIKFVVQMRNIAAGTLVTRLGLPEGTVLKHPVFEIYLDNEELGFPIISESHCYALGLALPEEIRDIFRMTNKVNAIMKSYLDRRDITLVDFRLHFGREEGVILISDSITPDTCRFWDKKTGRKLDRDVFGVKGGDIKVAYEEFLKRITNV